MSTETTRDRVRGILGMAIYYTPGWDEQVDACTAADNVLRAFRELGLVVVDAGRFERLRSVAVTYLDSTPGGITYMLQPGDLDPNATQPCNGERCCFCGRCLTTEEIYWYTNQCNDCAGSVQYDDDDPIPAPDAGDGSEGGVMHTGAGHDFDKQYLESLREQIADLSAERDALSEEQRMWQDRIQRLVVANTALAERVRRYTTYYAAAEALIECRGNDHDGECWNGRIEEEYDAARASIEPGEGG